MVGFVDDQNITVGHVWSARRTANLDLDQFHHFRKQLQGVIGLLALLQSITHPTYLYLVHPGFASNYAVQGGCCDDCFPTAGRGVDHAEPSFTQPLYGWTLVGA